MSGMRIRGLKARVGRECCIRGGGIRFSSEGIQAGEVRRGSHSTGSCGISRRNRDAAGRAVPGVRAVDSSEFRKEGQ